MSNGMTPIPPTDAIADAQVRNVLDALVQNVGVVKNDYINVDNIGEYAQAAITNVFNGSTDSKLTTSQIYAQILGSELYRKLSEPITLEFQTRIRETIAATQTVADNLVREATTRLNFQNVTGGQISAIQTVNNTQATQITGLTTRIGSAESTIVTLQSTTSSQATSLTSLTTRVGSAESSITSLQTTTASQATSLTSLNTRVGNAESTVSTLNTTVANQASTISSLSTTVSNNSAAISSEATTRANQVSALTTTVNQYTAAVTDPNTGAVATSSILQEYRTYANNANSTFNSSYTLRVNANGYVSGFGLQTTSGAGTSGGGRSDFIILADSFSLVTPGVSPVVPFTVSNGRAVFNGTLSAVNGTFTGNLSAAGGTFTGTLSGANGTFSGTLTAAVVQTDNIVSNALNSTYATSSSGSSASLSVYIPSGTSSAVIIVGLGNGTYVGTGESANYYQVYGSLSVDGTEIITNASGALTWAITNPPAGYHTVSATRNLYSSVMTIVVMVNKR